MTNVFCSVTVILTIINALATIRLVSLAIYISSSVPQPPNIIALLCDSFSNVKLSHGEGSPTTVGVTHLPKLK